MLVLVSSVYVNAAEYFNQSSKSDTYIVGCHSDYRDNLILSSPVVRNKTFDGVLKFYYYCKLGYIIIHFVK